MFTVGSKWISNPIRSDPDEIQTSGNPALIRSLPEQRFPAGNYLLKVRKNNVEMTLKVLKKQLRWIFFQLIVRPNGPDN